MRIGIFLFDGAEELDWAGPWEVLDENGKVIDQGPTSEVLSSLVVRAAYLREEDVA